MQNDENRITFVITVILIKKTRHGAYKRFRVPNKDVPYKSCRKYAYSFVNLKYTDLDHIPFEKAFYKFWPFNTACQHITI